MASPFGCTGQRTHGHTDTRTHGHTGQHSGFARSGRTGRPHRVTLKKSRGAVGFIFTHHPLQEWSVLLTTQLILLPASMAQQRTGNQVAVTRLPTCQRGCMQRARTTIQLRGTRHSVLPQAVSCAGARRRSGIILCSTAARQSHLALRSDRHCMPNG